MILAAQCTKSSESETSVLFSHPGTKFRKFRPKLLLFGVQVIRNRVTASESY